jgi:hypothetical protein
MISSRVIFGLKPGTISVWIGIEIDDGAIDHVVVTNVPENSPSSGQ